MYFFFENIIYSILGIDKNLIKVDSFALGQAFKKVYPFKIGFFVLNLVLNWYLCYIFLKRKEGFQGQTHLLFKVINLLIGIFLFVTIVLGIFSQRRFL